MYSSISFFTKLIAPTAAPSCNVTPGKIVVPVPTTECFFRRTFFDLTFVNSLNMHGPTRKSPEKSSDDDKMVTLEDTCEKSSTTISPPPI